MTLARPPGLASRMRNTLAAAGICLGARGNERYCFDPIGRALHRARLCILPQIDPGVTANGRCDGKAGSLSRTNRIAISRFLREKSSRRQDQS
jgi:hypothetical protein